MDNSNCSGVLVPPSSTSKDMRETQPLLGQTVSHWLKKHGKIIKPKLTEQQKMEMKQVFKLMDEDGSGAISAEEMFDAFELLGFSMSKAEIVDLVREVDHDGTGEVEYDEFLEIMTSTLQRVAETKRSVQNQIPFALITTQYKRKKLLEGVVDGTAESWQQVVQDHEEEVKAMEQEQEAAAPKGRSSIIEMDPPLLGAANGQAGQAAAHHVDTKPWPSPTCALNACAAKRALEHSTMERMRQVTLHRNHPLVKVSNASHLDPQSLKGFLSPQEIKALAGIASKALADNGASSSGAASKTLSRNASVAVRGGHATSSDSQLPDFAGSTSSRRLSRGFDSSSQSMSSPRLPLQSPGRLTFTLGHGENDEAAAGSRRFSTGFSGSVAQRPSLLTVGSSRTAEPGAAQASPHQPPMSNLRSPRPSLSHLNTLESDRTPALTGNLRSPRPSLSHLNTLESDRTPALTGNLRSPRPSLSHLGSTLDSRPRRASHNASSLGVLQDVPLSVASPLGVGSSLPRKLPHPDAAEDAMSGGPTLRPGPPPKLDLQALSAAGQDAASRAATLPSLALSGSHEDPDPAAARSRPVAGSSRSSLGAPEPASGSASMPLRKFKPSFDSTAAVAVEPEAFRGHALHATAPLPNKAKASSGHFHGDQAPAPRAPSVDGASLGYLGAPGSSKASAAPTLKTIVSIGLAEGQALSVPDMVTTPGRTPRLSAAESNTFLPMTGRSVPASVMGNNLTALTPTFYAVPSDSSCTPRTRRGVVSNPYR